MYTKQGAVGDLKDGVADPKTRSAIIPRNDVTKASDPPPPPPLHPHPHPHISALQPLVIIIHTRSLRLPRPHHTQFKEQRM